MPITHRTFRVFISSTFEDLAKERNALQIRVFPKLRTFCEARGARFQAIDLRWGVRDEAALDQRTMEICLCEIERCRQTGVRPNFIALLGRRYGWRPLPSHVPASEFDELLGRVPAHADRANLSGWYQRDNNAVPAEYVLRPRVAPEERDPATWADTEQRLRRLLADAARAAALPAEALLKYEASATHQEILMGLGGSAVDREHVFVFHRDECDDACDPELLALKRDLAAALPPGNVMSFRRGDTRCLCRQVECALADVMEKELKRFEDHPALNSEIDAHNAFARARGQVFGREDVLGAIAQALSSEDRRPLLVSGTSGSGKSVVMAEASERAKETVPGAVVVRRFIGVTQDSSDGASLLRSLCAQIARDYNRGGELPLDLPHLSNTFHDLVATASADRPLFVFIDGLDQLRPDDPAADLLWCDTPMPVHSRLVVSSSLEGRDRGAQRPVAIRELPATAAAAALETWFAAAHRTLQPAQHTRLMEAFAGCPRPLYLRLAFEAARHWPSFLPVEACALGRDTRDLLRDLFDRLSSGANHGPVLVGRSLAYLAAARHGLAEDELADVLSADRDVWSDFVERAHHVPALRRLPTVVLSRLLLDVEPFLAERSSAGVAVIGFFHRQVTDVVTERFLAGLDRRRRHRSLSAYFGAQADGLDGADVEPNRRKAVELIVQQLAGGQLDRAIGHLTRLRWIDLKCRLGLVFDLQDDYRRAFDALPPRENVRLGRFVPDPDVARWVNQLVAQPRAAATRRRAKDESRPSALTPESSSLPLPACRALAPDTEPMPPLRKETARMAALRSFSEFVEGEAAALQEFGGRPGFVAQQAYNFAPSGIVHRSGQRALVGLSGRWLLRRWPSDHRTAASPWERTIAGHHDVIDRMAMTPDGTRAFTSCTGGAIQVWNLSDGRLLRSLAVPTQYWHPATVRDMVITPDGTRVAASYKDGLVRVWEVETGACVSCVRIHPRLSADLGPNEWQHWIEDREVRQVWLSADGSLVVAATAAHRVHTWDVASSERVSSFMPVWRNNDGYLLGCSSDGRLAVVQHTDGTVTRWDVRHGRRLAARPGRRGGLNVVASSTDATTLLVLTERGDLNAWNTTMGTSTCVCEGLPELSSIALTPDWGRLVGLNGEAGRIEVWDTMRSSLVGAVPVSTEWTSGVCVSADGGRAVVAEGTLLRVLNLGRRLPQVGRREAVNIQAMRPMDVGGGRVATARRRGKVEIWNSVSGALEREVPCEGRATHLFRGPGTSLVVVSDAGDARVWDPATGTLLRSMHGQDERVEGAAMTPDRRRLFLLGTRRTTWDVLSGRLVPQHDGAPRRFRHALGQSHVSADGTRAVHSSAGGRIHFSDLDAGCEIASHRHNQSSESEPVQWIEIGPDGIVAATCLNNAPLLTLWNLRAGRELAESFAPNGSITALKFSPDGKRLVTGGGAGGICVWDLPALKLAAMVRLGRGYPADLVVSPDAGSIVSVRSDGVIQQWDIEDGSLLAVTCPPEDVRGVAIVGARRTLACLTEGGISVFEPAGTRPLPDYVVGFRDAADPRRVMVTCPGCGSVAAAPDAAARTIARNMAALGLDASPVIQRRLPLRPSPGAGRCTSCGRARLLAAFCVDLRAPGISLSTEVPLHRRGKRPTVDSVGRLVAFGEACERRCRRDPYREHDATLLVRSVAATMGARDVPGPRPLLAQAWGARRALPPPLVAWLTWVRLLEALLKVPHVDAGVALSHVRHMVGRLATLGPSGGWWEANQCWQTCDRLLGAVKHRLAPSEYRLLRAISSVLRKVGALPEGQVEVCQAEVARLDRFSVWRRTRPVDPAPPSPRVRPWRDKLMRVLAEVERQCPRMRIADAANALDVLERAVALFDAAGLRAPDTLERQKSDLRKLRSAHD